MDPGPAPQCLKGWPGGSEQMLVRVPEEVLTVEEQDYLDDTDTLDSSVMEIFRFYLCIGDHIVMGIGGELNFSQDDAKSPSCLSWSRCSTTATITI